MAKGISNLSFGKQIEYLLVGEMIREGLDVYRPVADNKGIDAVVRREDKTFIEVQIKARSKDVKQGILFGFNPFQVRRSYFFIFYAEGINTKWIFSSKELDAEAGTNKTGKHEGKRSITLGKRFDKYIATNFERLK